jgi:NADH-quinone oxidoreductase subunit G
MIINGKIVSFDKEKNLLEVIRKSGIELPTFCYYSELSIYGACRMCLVEEKRKGIMAACSEPPRNGYDILTHTPKLQKQRKNTMELLLANHDRECTTCSKNNDCKLQELSIKLGVDKIRFGKNDEKMPIDDSSPSIVRDPNKCILCGDCVRVCEEVQGIGVIGFAYRGSNAQVTTAFNKCLDEVDCVNCGQCISHCPTAALEIKSEIDKVWEAIYNPKKRVVAQIAPAVKVSFGEAFGLKPGEISTGKLNGALKALGFDLVFDTSFAADLTIMEESKELLDRINKGENLPLFTSCCPAWVKYSELNYPNLLDNLSTCRSPQQMFGAVVKKHFEKAKEEKDIYVVSIMPCTAKKAEAQRPEFSKDRNPDVDAVITTKELVKMVKSAGLVFHEIEESAFDMPFGFTTGAGFIFGVTGGVTEAVLRALNPEKVIYNEVRGLTGTKEFQIELGNKTIKAAIVNGLKNAKDLINKIKAGKAEYHIVEVMACPGGCVNGAGQPTAPHSTTTKLRGDGLYKGDKQMQLVRAKENPIVMDLYKEMLTAPGSHDAHELLHTHYNSRKRIHDMDLAFEGEEQAPAKEIKVCVGTCCYLKGAYEIFQEFHKQLEGKENILLNATFCFENCKESPCIKVDGELLGGVTKEDVSKLIKKL